MKKSQIYSIDSNDTSKLRTYLGSMNQNDNGFYYIYAVNDKYEPAELFINIKELNVKTNSEIVLEEVNSDLWGEVSRLISNEL